MPAPKYIPHYTLIDYRDWEGDWELWNGIPVATTPSPFGRHQWIAGRILTQLNRQLDNQGCEDCFALAETDWVISDDTVVRPDVVVVCGAFPERYIERAPRVIFEISSASTLHKDSTSKRDLYLHHRVTDYFIVDPNQNTIRHHWFNRESQDYQESTLELAEYQFDLHPGCKLQMDFSKIFSSNNA